MKVAILGDYHGRGMSYGENFAHQNDCEVVVQCGDFWSYREGTDIPHFYIAGNHEDFDYLARLNDGQVRSWSNLTHQDHYTTRNLDGATFGFVGGIQKTMFHLANFHALGGDDRMWVPRNEDYIDRLHGSDVLIFHDKPGMKEDNYLASVVDIVNPSLVFHGHFHKYDVSSYGDTTVYSLPACDPGVSYDTPKGAVLDTETLEVVIKPLHLGQNKRL